MRRAFSTFDIKSFNEDDGLIEGVASTPEPDRIGDVMEPKGAVFTLPLPLLWQHDADTPIGRIIAAQVTDAGIAIRAKIERGLLPEIDKAWTLIKSGLVRGLSIGFKPLESEDLDGAKGYFPPQRYTKWDWLELSAVTIPANQSATIQVIKSLCDTPAAPGRTSTRVRVMPAASGRQGTSMKTIGEQIKSFEATRQAKDARMADIMTKSADEGVTLDAAEKEEYDTLSGEVKEIDEHLVRLAELEKRNKAAAVPVQGTAPEPAQAARMGRISVRDTLPKGIRFARYAMCVAQSKGNYQAGLNIAKTMYPDEHAIHNVLEASANMGSSITKTAIGAGSTITSAWAGALVQYQDFLGDFVEYLRAGTIVDRFGTGNIPPLRRIPFNSRVAVQDAGGTGYWVGEGLPKPVTKPGFTTITLQWAKVANISVLTQEEVRFSSPSAEAKVRDDLAAALRQRLDIDFIDPSKAAVANVSPASITNGLVAIPASGTNLAAVRADFADAMQVLINGNIEPSSLVLIMSRSIALQLSLMTNATTGMRDFPDVTMSGGTLFGIPVITSEFLTTLGSPGTGMIVLVNASDIFLADDGNVTIDASDQASVEMLDSSLVQSGLAGTGASLVSLWQNDLLGLRAERFITWKRRRDAAVAYITNVAYVAT